ncbi:class I SAM-dependent methyltransferase [Candidatus Woesearchaeota archaeon]|nr:class I SAM-dependent methyltransferase [Candidatus Woesearchaeota archaeon]
MNPVQEFYNNPYFENLQETQPFLEYLAREEKEIRRNISGGRVLDIGCGNGRSTAILADVADKVIGIDLSERLLEQAKERLKDRKNVELYLENAKSTHFENDYFDCIVMLWNTFGNLYSARDKVFREAVRIVKPNRRIILSVFSENVLPAYSSMLAKNELTIEHQDENYVFLREGLVSKRFSEEKLREIYSNSPLGTKYEIKKLTDISYWCEVRCQKH